MFEFYGLKRFRIISEKTSLSEIYRSLNESEEKILFVVDINKKLIGTITDGDLRRFVEKYGQKKDAIARNIMNKNPKKIFENEIESINNTKLIKYHVNYLPIIDKNGKILKVVFLPLSVQKKFQKYTKILIMAGGKGTRLYPLTKIIPKPLVPYKDKTIVENIMENFLQSGFSEFLLSINYKKELIKNYFEDLKYNITYIEEKNFLGTAGSIAYMKYYNIKHPFFVANCDVILKENYYNILQYHKEQKADITIIASKENVNIAYGVLKIDEKNNYLVIEEKPNYSFYVNTGIYILNPDIINIIKIEEKLDMPELLERAKSIGATIKVYKSEREMIDIGRWKLYKKVL